MIGCKYSEFIDSLHLGHEFELLYKNKTYFLQRGDNSISIYDTTVDTVPFPIVTVITGDTFQDACDKFLVATIFDNQCINDIEKDIQILNED